MKRTLSLFAVSLMLVVIVSHVAVGDEEPIAPDPVFDPDLGPDVPVWSTGDFWNYTTDITYSLGIVSLDLTGWLNMSVVLITLDMFSNGDPVYITNITGNISGEDTFPIIGEVNIYIDFTGYIWSRCQDLSHYRFVLNASVSGTVSSINGNYPLGYEYSPPLEEYDFPLIPGENWLVETTATLPFGGGEILDISNNYTCGDPRDITVDGGTFNIYPVSIDGEESLFYNDIVGNSILRTFTVPAGTTDVVVPFELSAYSRKAPSIDIDLSIVEEQHIEAGSTFTLHGELSTSNVLINVFFPGGNLASTQTLIGSDTDLDVILTTPMFPDATPTQMDYGSLGIFVSVNGVQAIDVITVTTKAKDLEILEGDITIIPTGNGTIDDEFQGNVSIRNPSNFMVENYTIIIELPGMEGFPKTISNINTEARSMTDLNFSIYPDLPGNYTVKVTIDPDDNIMEFNETNNILFANFTVKERPEIIWESSPSTSELSITESENALLYAKATRAGEKIPGMWTYGDGNILEDNNFTFVSDFTGPNSSSFSPFIFTYVLDESYVYPGELDNISFTIDVEDWNRAPEIVTFSPNTTNVTVLEGETINFSVDVLDPDGDEMEYFWMLDGSYVNGNRSWNNMNWLNIDTNFSGWYSSEFSPYGVEVSVGDKKGNHSHVSWIINVIDVDRPFTVEFYPEPGNLTLLINETLTLSFNATDPDGTNVTSSWTYLNMTVMNSTGIVLDGATLGLEIGEVFDIELFLESNGINRTSIWTITINGTEEPEEPEPIPVEGLEATSPVNRTFIEGDNITFTASCDDGRTVYYIWEIDGETYNMTSVTINDLQPGNYTIVLRATVMEGIPGSANITFDIHVDEKTEPVEEEPEKDDEKDDPMWMVPLMVGMFIIIVLLVAIILFLSRKREDNLEWEE